MTITTDPANEAQLAAWDGDEGAYWAANADRYDRAMALVHARFLEAADVRVGQSVLDVGCGTGRTTLDVARRSGPVPAVGVDLSAAMLDVARRRAEREGAANAVFLQADAQVHPFDGAAFDLVVSRTGSMFFGDPVAAFTNLARALRPGGRVVLACWRPLADNEWMRELAGALAVGRDVPAPPAGAPGPFSLSDPDRVREVLGAAGLTAVDLEPVDATMWFGEDPADAAAFVLGQLGWMLEGLDEAARRSAEAALLASTSAHLGPDGVRYGSGSWLVRATRPERGRSR